MDRRILENSFFLKKDILGRTSINFLLACMLLFSTTVFAQIIKINDPLFDESKYDLQKLVEEVLVSGSACTVVDNFSFQVNGQPEETSTKSYGYFKTPDDSNFPFKEGIVITNGNAYRGGNNITSGIIDKSNFLPGDLDLESALNIKNTQDATFVKFNFTPVNDRLNFKFIMASEEYDGNLECNYSDGFAFLLRPVGASTYINIAIIPPSTPVSVTNINNSIDCKSNANFFEGYNIPDTNYGGRTKVLTASAVVIPNQVYEIKLVVADQGDSLWDSAIFLEAGSFKLDANLGGARTLNLNNAVCGTDIVLDARINATSYKWFKDEVEIAGETNKTYTANLGDGFYKVEAILGSNCLAIDEVEIEFTKSPYVKNVVSDLVACLDHHSTFATFNLEERSAEILDGQDPDIYEVLYFEDATYRNEIDPDLINNFQSTGQTIYAGANNKVGLGCSVERTSFLLRLLGTSNGTTNIPPLIQCDNTSIGTETDGFTIFNLEERKLDILNGNNEADFTIFYFRDQNYSNEILQPEITNFMNDISGGQSIYYQLKNNFDPMCFEEASFEIVVNSDYPVISTPVTLTQCDDDLDGFEAFNLTEVEFEISTNATNEEFTYYLTQSDAVAGILGTEIKNPSTFINPTKDLDTVWVSISNQYNCARIGEVILDVNPSDSILNGVLYEFDECDNGTDITDGIATFDFSYVATDIKLLFAPLIVNVYFYENENDANEEVNEINPSGYQNKTRNQNIWVRVESDLGNDCLGKGEYVTLNVNEVPLSYNPTSEMKACDVDNDGVFPFDVSMIEAEVLSGQSLLDVSIEYYNEDGTLIGNQLPNPFNTSSQTIDIVVTNRNQISASSLCSTTVNLEFTVDILPINNKVLIEAACDSDATDNKQIATFDTSTLESQIGAQSGMSITYTDISGNELTDALGNKMNSPFPNSFTSSSKTILVTVANPISNNCSTTNTIDFIVNKLPEVNFEESTIMLCENRLPQEISIKDVLSNYEYKWFNENNEQIGVGPVLVISDSNLINNNEEVLTVIVTDKITGCTNDNSITVYKSSIASLTDDEIISIEFSSPENSIEIKTSNLGSGNYVYALEHPKNMRPFQGNPIFLDLLGGIYTLKVRDLNGCGEFEKQIVLLDFPKFFTPNNDGINDVWQILGSRNNTKHLISNISIFDRFGKLVALIDSNNTGWDGLFNNEQLPSSDYWFLVNITDDLGIVTEYKGHFSLIRK